MALPIEHITGLVMCSIGRMKLRYHKLGHDRYWVTLNRKGIGTLVRSGGDWRIYPTIVFGNGDICYHRFERRYQAKRFIERFLHRFQPEVT